jgi:hypothetical protein
MVMDVMFIVNIYRRRVHRKKMKMNVHQHPSIYITHSSISKILYMKQADGFDSSKDDFGCFFSGFSATDNISFVAIIMEMVRDGPSCSCRLCEREKTENVL